MMVWIIPEKCWGTVVKRFPLFCIVEFYNDNNMHEEVFEYSELTEPSEMGIDYEDETI